MLTRTWKNLFFFFMKSRSFAKYTYVIRIRVQMDLYPKRPLWEDGTVVRVRPETMVAQYEENISNWQVYRVTGFNNVTTKIYHSTFRLRIKVLCQRKWVESSKFSRWKNNHCSIHSQNVKMLYLQNGQTCSPRENPVFIISWFMPIIKSKKISRAWIMGIPVFPSTNTCIIIRDALKGKGRGEVRPWLILQHFPFYSFAHGIAGKQISLAPVNFQASTEQFGSVPLLAGSCILNDTCAISCEDPLLWYLGPQWCTVFLIPAVCLITDNTFSIMLFWHFTLFISV